MKKSQVLAPVITIFLCLRLLQAFSQDATTVAGGINCNTGPSDLNAPSDLFIDPSGNIYIADNGNNRIQKWTPGASEGITVAGGNGPGSAANQLNNPYDVFVDALGNIYIADRNNNRIQKWTPGASQGITVAGGNGPGSGANQFNIPASIFVDATGNIFIADEGNNRIQKWAAGVTEGITVAGGNGAGSAANQLQRPGGIILDPSGNMYIADADNDRVQKWAPGAVAGVTIAGGNGRGMAENQLSLPSDIFLDKTGNLYVADFINYRVQKWTPGASKGITVAGGNDGAGGLNDANLPTGISVDLTGNLYVVDLECRVRKIESGLGLSYKYYEGSWNALPDFSQITPVKTGNSANVDISARTPGRQDNFAFVWEGYIVINTPGTYTFETVSDDGSRFYFNSLYSPGAAPTVNNDGIHAPYPATGTVTIPGAGVYPISITYFEKEGGEDMKMYWSGPGITRQLIPDWALTSTAPPASAGLTYKYYEGTWNTLPDFSTLTPRQSGVATNVQANSNFGGPPPTTNYAYLWEGFINMPTPGTYTFETVSDDGSKLYFNTQYNPAAAATVNNDGIHASSSATGTVSISAAGIYSIAMSYFQREGGRQMEVYWTGPGIQRQRIPDFAFTKVARPLTKGLQYKYFEGSWNTVPDFTRLIPVKKGNSPNIDLGVKTPGRNDNFAIQWQGYIYIPTPGRYTFETMSDDGSKIYFNSSYESFARGTVNNDGVHPPTLASGSVDVAFAGAYPITITYFEKEGGETMQIYWTGPGITRQLIPDAAFTQSSPPPSSGLAYKYYEGTWESLPDFDAITPVKTGNSANTDLGVRPFGRNDNFGLLWQGYIKITTPGNYTFETVSDDGSKLYFNSMYNASAAATVSNDGVHPPASATGMVNIPAAGKYPIAISFFEKNGGEQMQVYWTGPGIDRRLVPDSVFSPMVSAAPVVTSEPTTWKKLNSNAATNIDKANVTISNAYPNPFSENFNIEFLNSSESNNIQVGLYSQDGRLVYFNDAGKLRKGYASLNVKLDGYRLTTGLYLARLFINGTPSKSLKLVKTR